MWPARETYGMRYGPPTCGSSSTTGTRPSPPGYGTPSSNGSRIWLSSAPARRPPGPWPSGPAARISRRRWRWAGSSTWCAAGRPKGTRDDRRGPTLHLLADPSVDALPQQVGMAAVTGVLLHPVQEDLPYGDPLSADPFAQIRVLGEEGVGGGLLAGEVGEGGVDHGLVTDRVVELGITPPVQSRRRIARQDPAPPCVLGRGQVPDQPEQ